jgi:tetratricopeptide (TPR) repeat protein
MGALALLLGLALGPPAGGAPAVDSPSVAPGDALARGDALHAQLDYEGARREYERAVAIAPRDFEARVRLAHVLNDLAGKELFEEALRVSEALVRDAPDRAEGHYWRAASLANLMPYRPGPEKVTASREIERSARQAIDLDPCLAPAYAALAITYRELARVGGLVRALASAALGGLPKGSLEDAEGLLRAAVALDPRDPFSHYQLALTLEARGRGDEAIAALRRVVDLPDRETRDRRNRHDAAARLARLAETRASRQPGE